MTDSAEIKAEAEIVLGRKNGMHITPAVMLCKLQEEYAESIIVIKWRDKELGCKSPILLSASGITFGENLTIHVTGEQAEAVLEKAVKIVESD